MHEGRMVAPIEILNGVAKAFPTGFKSGLQSVRMAVVPFFMSLPSVVLYHVFQSLGLYSGRVADEPIINVILPFIGGVHVFLSGVLFFREGDYGEMRRAVRSGDKEKFLDLVEDQVPTPLRFVVFVTGSIVILWTLTLYNESYWRGLFSVLSVSYIVSLIWEVIADFNDPVNGVWVVKNIPPEWLEGAKIKKRWSDQLFSKIFKED